MLSDVLPAQPAVFGNLAGGWLGSSVGLLSTILFSDIVGYTRLMGEAQKTALTMMVVAMEK